MLTACWEIVYADDGTEIDDEYHPHYPTALDALSASTDYDPGTVKAVQRARLCHTIDCDICGETGDEDNGANHFETEQLAEVIDNLGWTPIPVGTGAVCDMCCEVEVIVATGAPVVPGQGVLI